LHGATWGPNDGQFYASANNSGTIYAIANPLGVAPSITATYNATISNRHDGMSCSLAGPPFGPDRSDAPVSGTSYGEALHTNPSNALSLGGVVDIDLVSIAGAGAAGDGADDDGVTIPAMVQGQSTTVIVSITQENSGDGFLQGWIDFNGNGSFGDAGEQVATNLQFTSGVTGNISVPVSVPATAITTQTYARFRWSTASGLNSTATASNGEVEDYALTIASGIAITANNDDFSGTPIDGISGGTTASIFANDDLDGSTPDDTTVTASLTSLGGLDGLAGVNINPDGTIILPPGTLAGTFTLTYEICDTSNPTICDTANIIIVVEVPFANSQSCPAGESNLVSNGDFSSGLTGWTDAGVNAGNLDISSYTGSPSGATFTNVLFEDANNTSGELSQSIASGITEAPEMQFNFGWNNESSGQQAVFTISLSGTDIFRVETTAAADDVSPANFFFLNGTSGTLGTTSFSADATGQIPISLYLQWDLIPITLTLPSGLPDSGDLRITYVQALDDWAVDDLTLCFSPSPNLIAAKSVSMLDSNEFAIPGNDVVYTINVVNTGDGSVDSDSIFLVDSLPSEVTFFNGDHNGTAPGTDVIGFIAGTSGLTGLNVGYAVAGPAPTEMADCTYTPPTPNAVDSNVRYICLSPTGTMVGGDPDPSFSVSIRARLN